MSGPKHLWSGDWERDSDQAPAAYEPPPTQPEPAPSIETEPRQSLINRIGSLGLLFGGVGLLVIAAVAVALVVGLSGSPRTARRNTSTPAAAPSRNTAPNTSAGTGGAAIGGSPSVPQAYWLGMQILSTPLGATVTTVALGSVGDKDGFSPGDSISAIGTTQVDSVAQLRAALANVPIGQAVKVTITRGSGSLSANVTLTKRPTDKP